MQRVLFLCTGNSARSQMAEGLVNALYGDTWLASSAGTRPAGVVHPLAVAAMQEIGIDISTHHSKPISEVRDEPFDMVITVCASAARECPLWLGQGRVIHAPMDDPAAEGSEKERLDAFRVTRDALRQRLVRLLGIESA
jgi:arsenate reductase